MKVSSPQPWNKKEQEENMIILKISTTDFAHVEHLLLETFIVKIPRSADLAVLARDFPCNGTLHNLIVKEVSRREI